MPPITESRDPKQIESMNSQYCDDSKFEPRPTDEIDFRMLWNVIWGGKWIIIAGTAIFTVFSVLYALSLPNVYQSTVLLAPSEDAQGGGVSRMAGQLGGLASLAGLSVSGAAGGDKVAVAIAVLKSRKFIDNFIQQHSILPQLMAVDHWALSSRKLFLDSDIYDADNRRWVRDVEPPKTSEPSAWEAYDAFIDILTVSLDKETGFVTVAIEHQSPDLAQRWVSWLVDDVNKVMKNKDVIEARRSIEFLETQLAEVALADMRTVFYQLIEEQTKTIMLAEVRDEYVFSTIDPAVVAEEKIKPRRALIAALGMILSGIISMTIVFVRYFIKRPNK